MQPHRKQLIVVLGVGVRGKPERRAVRHQDAHDGRLEHRLRDGLDVAKRLVQGLGTDELLRDSTEGLGDLARLALLPEEA